jgi:hypothetical protein
MTRLMSSPPVARNIRNSGGNNDEEHSARKGHPPFFFVEKGDDRSERRVSATGVVWSSGAHRVRCMARFSWIDSWPRPPVPMLDPDVHLQRVTAPHFYIIDHPPRALIAACETYMTEKDKFDKFYRCVDDWTREHDYGVKYPPL